MMEKAMKSQALSTDQKVAEELRAHQRRRPGVPYELRVIDGSGGMLELVEDRVPAKRHWFHEWARAMQFSNFGM
jgi:hypothetical protein